MRIRGIHFLIPILFLCLVLVVSWAVSFQLTALSQLQFTALSQQIQLELFCEEEDGRYYLTLPSFLSLEEITFSHPWYLDVVFSSGSDSISDFSQIPLDQPLTVSLSLPLGKQVTYPFQVLQCSANRTIFLDMQDGAIDYLQEDKTRKRDTSVMIYDEKGDTEYQGIATISGRGNATWNWAKKPYNLDFSETISVGPFQDVTRLCLFAEYADESKLRNSLAYYAGQELGIPYCSPYAFTDVYINGQYYGLCALTVKEEYTKQLASDGIQAVFELTSSENGTQFTTDLRQRIRVIYGDPIDVQYVVECFENALSAQDWSLVSQYIDLESWALKYAMDEFLFNTDLGWASQYFYWGEDGKIRSMLPWDYEWTLESIFVPYVPGQQKEIAAYQNSGNWFGRLLKNEDFVKAVHTTLQEQFTEELFLSLDRHMEEDIQQITGSWRCDRIRWRSTLYDNQKPHLDPALLLNYREQFRTYFPNRLEFLLEFFSHIEDYLLVSFQYQSPALNFPARFMLVLPKGSDLRVFHEDILNSTETFRGENFQGWYTEDGTPLEEIGILTEDLRLTGIFLGP